MMGKERFHGAVFTTARLAVRPPTLQDLDFMVSMYGDEHSMRFLGGPLPRKTIEDRLKSWIEAWKTQKWASSILVLKQTGEQVGQIA